MYPFPFSTYNPAHNVTLEIAPNVVTVDPKENTNPSVETAPAEKW